MTRANIARDCMGYFQSVWPFLAAIWSRFSRRLAKYKNAIRGIARPKNASTRAISCITLTPSDFTNIWVMASRHDFSTNSSKQTDFERGRLNSLPFCLVEFDI
jgi:hypothetical protein